MTQDKVVVPVQSEVDDPVVEGWWVAGTSYTPGDKLVEEREGKDPVSTREEESLRITLSGTKGEGWWGSQHHAGDKDRSATRGGATLLGRVESNQIHECEEE